MFTINALIFSKVKFPNSFNSCNNSFKMINTYLHNICQEVKLRRFSSQPQEKLLMTETFPMLINELCNEPVYDEFPDLKNMFRNLMDYSLAIRCQLPSRLVLATYELVEQQSNMTTEKLKLARILACCTEMTNASLLLAHDCVENTTNRNDAPTWHTKPEIEMKTVGNDAVILENSIYYVLKNYFFSHPKYRQIIDLFHEATEHFLRGLYLQDTKYNVENLNISHIEKIAVDTIGYRCLFLPVTISLHLANVYEDYDYSKMKAIMSQVAVHYKVKNDFLDTFGNDAKNNNIRKGRISWLFLKCQEKGNVARMCLQENYGKDDDTAVKKVQKLYEQLDMETEFKNFSNISSDSIQSLIKTSSNKEQNIIHKVVEISHENNL